MMLATLMFTLISQPIPLKPASSHLPYPVFCSRPEYCVTPVDKGDLAPFSGSLLSPARAAELGETADMCGKRIDLATRTASTTCKLGSQLATGNLKLDLAISESKLKTSENEVSRLSSWWREPVIDVLAGMLLTALVVGLVKQ